MADDYYRFVESAHLLRGENTQKIYRLGDKVDVQVIRVNMELRQIDLGSGRDSRARAGGSAWAAAKPRDPETRVAPEAAARPARAGQMREGKKRR